MSLIERACGTQGAAGAARRRTNDSERLRARVAALVSPDEIAATLAANPQQARNEVRSACQRIFFEPEWQIVGLEERKRLTEEVVDAMFGFGPLEDLIDDPDITEIMVNGTQSAYCERNGQLHRIPCPFTSDDEIRTLIDRMIGPLGRRIDEASPMVSARLAQGHRVNAIIPPLSLVGPVLTIRKFTERVMRLADMQAKRSFGNDVGRLLSWAVLLRKNIAVSGGTGVGKTTLLNALSCEIPPDERIITIEDSAELRFLEHPHVVRLEARPRNAEGTGEVTIRDLVTNALRMRPDRIVVGECRGAEALDMLQAMNTGHDGSLTTLHANAPSEAISRLETMVRYGADLPVDVVDAYIASALDLIVHLSRGVHGQRYVSEIVEVGFDEATRSCTTHRLYYRDPLSEAGCWTDVPAWADDVIAFGHADEQEVARWRLSCSSHCAPQRRRSGRHARLPEHSRASAPVSA